MPHSTDNNPSMEFNLPRKNCAIIKVIGVGGGGSNAVNNMYKQGIRGVDFAICNTDKQALDVSAVPCKIQLGPSLTDGLGAGSRPNIGREACLESLDDIKSFFEDSTKMVFVTAGLGGGTGTGAAPVIAKAAQEMDILTVGIVTTPFKFEGKKRHDFAMEGLEEIKKNVDTLIVISNEKLKQNFGNLSFSQAFEKADNILTMAAKGIAEIITVAGYVNVDFEDVNTVMRVSGVAIMGSGVAEGDNRALTAVKNAIASPLLEDNSITGAKNVLLNITSGMQEITMDEISTITDFVQDEAGVDTNLIWGTCIDENLGNKICVTLIATGFDKNTVEHITEVRKNEEPVRVMLETTKPKPVYEDSNDHIVPPVAVQSSLDDILRDDEDDAPVDKPYKYGKDMQVNLDLSKRNKKQPAPTTNKAAVHSNHINQPAPAEPLINRPKPELPLNNRKGQLKGLSTLGLKLNNQETVNHMESEPAYKRRNPEFREDNFSNEEQISGWIINDDEKPTLNKNNNFLHKSVD